MIDVERISSGSAPLDRVLHGGLPANAINLVIGAPGTGKTILADQYVFMNATEDRPALYYSTVSEPYEKLLRYGQTLHFFDSSAVGQRVFYEALGPVVRDGGLDAVVKKIADDIKLRRPGIIVIDSFRALAAFAAPQPFRIFLADLSDLLTAFPVSAFWIGEYTSDDVAVAPEFAVADAVIALSRETTGLRQASFLQVLKLRGSGFLTGSHACRLSAAGIQVFPRLADSGDTVGYEPSTTRASTGIEGLDVLLDGGFLSGSSTLVAGPSGVGKTLMGLTFLFAGLRVGEPAVIASFQENPSQLASIALGFGMNLADPNIELLYESFVDLYIDEWMYKLLDRIAAVGAKRVVIDSLGDLEASTPDQTRFREFVYSFIQRCASDGVGVLFTMGLNELFNSDGLTGRTLSPLVDNIILLQYERDRAAVRRSLTVIKSRGTAHDPHIHEYAITGGGIVLSDDVTVVAEESEQD